MQRVMQLTRHGRWAAAILALHLVLGVLYSLAVPPWEAHDEWAHYKFVEYVARHRALPPPDQRLTTEYEYDEANQPPLYYIVAALPVMLVDVADGVRPDVNPYFGSNSGVGGINAAVHHPEQERFPWRGTLLALRLARGASLLIGLLGLAAVYRLGRLLAPGRPSVALIALAIAASSPQYLFISSVVTNDVLIAALGCIVAWLAVQVVLEGLRPLPALALALAAGLALLTKLSALALLPFVLLALIAGGIRALRRGESRRAVWLTIGLTLLAATAAGGAWFVSNWRATGHWLPRDPWVLYRLFDRWIARIGDAAPVQWAALPSALVYAFRTFWASFGWGNLEAYRWVYWLFAALCAVGLLGWLGWLAQRRTPFDRKIAAGLLAVLVISVFLMAAYRDFDYGGDLIRGRYLLPALGAVATLLALGLDTLAGGERSTSSPQRPSQPRRVTLTGAGLLSLGLILVALNIVLPLGVIIPAYAPPAAPRDATLLPGEQPLDARFGDAAELLAYELWPETVRPGEALGVTLLWRTLKPTDRDYTLAVHLLDAQQNKVGQVHTYPGRGAYATTIWQPGRLMRETYWVVVEEPIIAATPGMRLPILGRVKVALFLDDIGGRNPDRAGEHLPITDAHGDAVGDAIMLERFKLAPRDAPGEPTPAAQLAGNAAFVGAVFAETIRLDAAAWMSAEPILVAGDVVTVTLAWSALGRPAADYQVFVHLDRDLGREPGEASPVGRPAAFGDGPPAGGLYPTGLWDRGEQIEDSHAIHLPADMPAGHYALTIGLYDATGRASAAGRSGERLPNDAAALARLRVQRRDQKNFVPFIVR